MRIVVRKSFAAVAACGAVLLAGQGCSSAPSKGPDAAGTPMALGRALVLAQNKGRHMTSMRANINVHVTTVTKHGTVQSTTTGTVQAKRTPAPESDSKLRIASATRTVPMEEIETPSTIYLKLASLAGNTGKPWVSFPSVGASAGLTQGNPLSLGQFLSVSHNLHPAGTAVVNGVSTTRYVGTYPPTSLLTGLSAKVRQKLAARLKNAGPASVSIWISADGQLQKMTIAQTIHPQTIVTTIDITAVNVPVTIVIPPPSQVAPIPLSALGHL